MSRSYKAHSPKWFANLYELKKALRDAFVSRLGSVMTQTASDYTLVLEREGSATNTSVTCLAVRHVTDGDMADGFGAALGGSIRDDADVNNLIGVIKFRRDGADNSGRIEIQTRNAGSYVNALYLYADGGVEFPNIKAGATQVAAGAAAGELYVDTDTNVVMRGV